MNPVLAREAKERFRGRRALPFLTLWVFSIGLVTYAMYLLAQEIASGTGLGRLVATGYVGRFLFQAMVLILLTAVIFLVPSSAAVAIVTERERQTLHLLQVTQLGPFQLVLGKLSASISYLMILLVAALPMAAIPLIFGGATFGDVLAALAMLLITAFMLASVSVWVSSRARSARGAVAGALSISFLIAFFTFALMGLEIFWNYSRTNTYLPREGGEIFSVLPNPYFGVVDAVIQPYELRQDMFTATPFAPFEILLFGRQGVNQNVGGFVDGVRPGAVRLIDGRQLINRSRPPLYLYTIAIYALISAVSLRRATLAVTAPGGRSVRVKRVRGEDA